MDRSKPHRAFSHAPHRQPRRDRLPSDPHRQGHGYVYRKTPSELMTWRNHLSRRNDWAALFRLGRRSLAIHVRKPRQPED